MTWIRWDAERRGLEGLPAGFVPVARDALGDVLAHDASGAVFCFPHGTGSWQPRERAFASLDQLRSYVEFQGELEIPDSLDLAGLRAKKLRLEAFAKSLPRAPYAKDAIGAVLATLREAIAEQRSAQSKSGRDRTARQELSLRCEAALRAAGHPGDVVVRPHLQPGVLAVMACFEQPWTQARVQQVLQLLLGAYRLEFCARPSRP